MLFFRLVWDSNAALRLIRMTVYSSEGKLSMRVSFVWRQSCWAFGMHPFYLFSWFIEKVILH